MFLMALPNFVYLNKLVFFIIEVSDFSYYWAAVCECCIDFIFISSVNLVLAGLFIFHLEV